MNTNTAPTAQTLTDATAHGHESAIKALAEVGQSKCNCSDTCYSGTRNLFHQGHDARMVSRLVDQVVARDGEFANFSLADAVTELKRRGGTANLEIKLRSAVAKAHDRWTKRAEAAARKAAKASAPKAARKSVKAAKVEQPAQPQTVRTEGVRGKVGRWTYNGFTTQTGDNAPEFHYKDRLQRTQVVTKFTVVDN